MRKLLLSLALLVAGAMSVWAQIQVSTSVTDPEYQYFITNGNNAKVGKNAVNSDEAGRFAFYAVENVENAYYIYSLDETKWFDYEMKESYGGQKNFVKLSSEKGNYFYIESCAKTTGYYQISPYTSNDKANIYLNYFQGVDGTSTLGLWTANGDSDKGSRYIFTSEIEYTLTDVAGNVFTGSYVGVGGTTMPTITGVAGHEITNPDWDGNKLTATISFPVTVSSAEKTNGTTLTIFNDQKFLRADGTDIKVQTTGVKALDLAAMWAIYPSFENGKFTFTIKNLSTGKYIYSDATEASHDSKGTVILSETASKFVITGDRDFCFDGKTLFLSINSTNDTNVWLGVYGRQHGGTNIYTPTTYGTEANPYLINNVNDFVLFRNSVNAGETTYNAEGVYVALGADIDLDGQDWSVNIGDDCNVTFDGIFDGQDFTISNLTATETATKADGYICSGLFGAIAGNAVVKNFTIENVTINAEYVGNNVAAVVGFALNAKGSIENVTVTGEIKINAPEVTGVGAILGYDYYSPTLKVEGCEVIGAEASASSIIAKSYAGGLVGYASSKIALNGNTVENVTVTGTASVGAIAGIMLVGSSAADNTVMSVAVSATGELWANSAAVVAGTITSNGGVTISNTTVESVTINDTEFDDSEEEDPYASVIVGGKLVEHPTEPIAKVEAKIGDTYYATLEAAMAATGDDEVELLVEKSIVLNDGEAYTYTKGAYDVDVEYSRDLIPGIWNPVYLPFDFDLESDKFEVAEFTSAEGATVTLTKLDANEFGKIDLFANIAYVVRPIGDNTTLECSIWGSIFKNEEVNQDLGNGFSVRGNYSVLKGSNLGAYDRVVSTNGKWGVLKEESTLKPFRLILSVPEDFTPEQSAAISMRVLDNTTGVEETIMDGQEAIVIYDLMGRRVETMTEGGIYIVNGRKVIR